MLSERVEQRVLGALQLLDSVTQTAVTRTLRIRSGTAAVIRNRRGLYVITRAAGLEAHAAAFPEAPATPALSANTYQFEISDPRERYLPRLLTLRLPRDPDPANIANDDSLFQPGPVLMYPAGTALLSHNWSSIRAAVTRGQDVPVAGALIQIIEPLADTVLASGFSDQRGEALVIVPGVPVTKFADDESDTDDGDGEEPAVVVNSLPVRLELSLDVTAPWPVDPDVMAQNHEANRSASMDVTLSAGKMETVAINLT
jgi:hypothetical protein